jgi:hypothetical protein
MFFRVHQRPKESTIPKPFTVTWDGGEPGPRFDSKNQAVRFASQSIKQMDIKSVTITDESTGRNVCTLYHN